MTDGHESDFLVTVRAQVMTRDESTEGWLPLAGGGLANVSIRKRAKLSPGALGHEYIIYGQRISDQSVILSCVINRDLKYFKVMPTFHHWRAGKQRNGLTFQTAADARAFDKGVVRAYNELIDGLAKSNPAIVCPPLNKYDSVGEDDVFMTLDLPVESESIQKVHSSPEGSEKSHRSINDLGERHKDISKSDSADISTKTKIHYISNEKVQTLNSLNQINNGEIVPALTMSVSSAGSGGPSTLLGASSIETPATIAPSENYSYVTLTAVHDYNYPVVDQPATAQVLNARRESISALKKQNALAAAQQLAALAGGPQPQPQQQQQTLQTTTTTTSTTTTTPLTAAILKDPNVDLIKKQQQQHKATQHRKRCRYCNEFYEEEWNRKGSCEFAPDVVRNAFECISGMGCARCMLYHCMSDDEGETIQHPCSCLNEEGCVKRWIGLALLSLVVPCLWCYPPLRACHWIGVTCGVCGGKHKPQD